jgi:hypothetical protein
MHLRDKWIRFKQFGRGYKEDLSDELPNYNTIGKLISLKYNMPVVLNYSSCSMVSTVI